MARFFKVADIDLIDLDALVRMLPGKRSWNVVRNLNRGRYVTAMLRSWEALDETGINNARRLAHFIGQGLIETGFLNYTVENLNYSEKALIATFSRYRDNPELAKAHARKERLIANTVYGERMGNVGPDDGWNYRGRGFIQLTGKNNYAKYGDAAGIDLVKNPDKLHQDLKTSIKVAAAFWRTNGLNQYADANNVPAVSRGVNRGNPNSSKKAHGEDKRIIWTNYVLSLMEDTDRVMIDENAPLDVGSRGAAVKKLQQDLNLLGYDVGKADGVFGRKTGLGVLNFQHEHGLNATGAADKATRDAIAEAVAEGAARAPAENALDGAYDVEAIKG